MNRKRGLAIWTWGMALILILALAGPVVAAPTWLQLNPTPDPIYGSPPGLFWHTAVYNPASNRMIIFAGAIWGSIFNDVWVLTNADGLGGTPAWTKLNPLTPNGAPAPRSSHTAAYDQANNRMIVYGGHTMPGYCEGVVNDVWILTNADGTGGNPTWIPLATMGAPARRYPKAVYDAANNRLLVHGGDVTACGPNFDDAWVLTNANGLAGEPVWTSLDPAFSFPTNELPWPGPVGYDPANNVLIAFGLHQTGGF